MIPWKAISDYIKESSSQLQATNKKIQFTCNKSYVIHLQQSIEDHFQNIIILMISSYLLHACLFYFLFMESINSLAIGILRSYTLHIHFSFLRHTKSRCFILFASLHLFTFFQLLLQKNFSYLLLRFKIQLRFAYIKLKLKKLQNQVSS